MRRRSIAPEFFLHQDVASCTPHARLLFVSLWTQVDRAGRMRWVALQVHGNSFPHEPELDVPSMVAELEARGLVVRYEAEGRSYLWLPGFTRWQRPHKNEPPSLCPEPDPSGSGDPPDGRRPLNGGSRRSGSSTPYRGSEDQRTENTGSGLAFGEEHRALILARSLLAAIKSHSPEYSAKVTESRLQGWALEIDRSIRLDGYSEDQIGAVVRWAHREDPRGFWRGNMLSGSKLRKQLPRLVAQGRAEGWLSSKPGASGVEGFVEQHGDLLLRFRDRCAGSGGVPTPELLSAYAEEHGVDVGALGAPLVSWLEGRP